jgi:two-component system, cell cycle response regulator
MRVLVVEDSHVYRHLLTSNLDRWGFPFVVAKNGNEAWTLLQRADCPKLILLDWVLPDIDGIELCRRIRQSSSVNSYSYIILLTGKDAQNDVIEAMEAGADDYLVKPFNELELKARLLVGKRIVGLHEELVASRESMRHAATHDSLTGLLNRGEIMDLLSRETERSKRGGKPLSIILADVDHFKKVNDTLGHLFGDEALKEVAKRLRSKLRAYDGLGRYGGEEFLLVLTECDLMSVLIKADALRTAVGGTPVVSSRISKNVTVSMGVATSSDHAPGDITSLLQQADQGLYLAKAKGRNRVEHSEETGTGVIPVAKPALAKR